MEQPLATFTSIQIWPKIYLKLYESEVEVDRGAMPAGRITKRLRYEQIANVALSKNWMYTSLIIESTGGHTLDVERMEYAAAEEASDAIRQRMALVASSSGSSASPANDIFAQLQSLADLREADIITQAEFEAKKKELLERVW
jgi:putative oligomerization/nucleic acid binding protein